MFCHLVRDWKHANDDPGLTVMEGVGMRTAFKDWLLQGISFSEFPRCHGFIKGFPACTFEAVVAAIDGYLQLHALIPSNSFNVRSVNTNDNGTYKAATRRGIPLRQGILVKCRW